MIDVSVVIINWNHRDLLKNCLESLEKQTHPILETIVVDNGSTDDSVAVAQSYGCRVISNPENAGFCVASNQGFRIAKGQYVFLLNNDTTLDEDCIGHLVEALSKSQPGCLGVFPKVVLHDEPKVINAFGVIWNKKEFWRDMRTGLVDLGVEKGIQRTFGSMFAAVLFDKNLFMEIGMFDEDLFSYGEDFDVCYRANIAGYTLDVCAEAIVYHKFRSSAGEKADPEWANFFFIRNYLMTILKNYELRNVLIHFPRALYRFYVKGILWALRWRNYPRLRTHFRVAASLVRLSPLILRKRRVIREMRKKHDVEVWDCSHVPPFNPYYYDNCVVISRESLEAARNLAREFSGAEISS